jgi:lipopolysaccharide export system permease protein
MVQFDQRGVKKLLTATNMAWLEDKKEWRLTTVQERVFTDSGFVEHNVAGFDTLLSLLPQDLARSSSDIYQLSYTEAFQYIDGIKRSGASGIEIPQVQLYARMAYPFSIVVVLVIGFAVAAVRRKGGKGVYIAAGLVISFLYLVIMKIMEPFGALGLLPTIWAALIPHLLFLCVGLIGIKLIRK